MPHKYQNSESETPVVHNSVCSQFSESSFAILFEVLPKEIQEEIHHFAGCEGGGLRRTKIVNKNFVNKPAFPIHLKKIHPK